MALSRSYKQPSTEQWPYEMTTQTPIIFASDSHICKWHSYRGGGGVTEKNGQIKYQSGGSSLSFFNLGNSVNCCRFMYSVLYCIWEDNLHVRSGLISSCDWRTDCSQWLTDRLIELCSDGEIKPCLATMTDTALITPNKFSPAVW